MLQHWNKAIIALSDNEDVCAEWWLNDKRVMWFDVHRDGSCQVRLFTNDGACIISDWDHRDRDAMFSYMEGALTGVYGEEFSGADQG